MKIFNLPDLGEGLPDAEIREWYVKVGDTVAVDQPMVSVETAKALVDVPCPQAGKIEKLFGNTGDRINTGEALIGFEGEAESAKPRKDSGTVVGHLAESQSVLQEAAAGIQTAGVKASPAVRALAKKLNIDLNQVTGTGPNGHVTAADIERFAEKNGPRHEPTPAGSPRRDAARDDKTIKPGYTALTPMQRAMVLSMKSSQSNVVAVTICDDAEIQNWEAGQNITVRIIRAIAAACKAEPMLNSHFDGENLQYRTFDEVNLGIAVDTPHGLYVPVIKDVAKQTDADLRANINRLKELANSKSIPAAELKDATILLSNFGSLAGRYATPIVVPPTVCIVAIGKLREENGKRLVPISISMDHRVIAGGQVARFLKAMMDHLGLVKL